MTPIVSDNLFFLPLEKGSDRSSDLDYFVGDQANEPLRVLFDLERLDAPFWPIVFYGPSGTGKTALAQSVIDRFARVGQANASSEPQTLLITAVDFARGLMESIQTKSVEPFIEKLLSFRSIAFDSLDALEQYPFVQPDLVSILDRLQESRIPVVVTISRFPDSCPAICDALLSRLSAGLAIPVNGPGFDARCYLISQLAKKLGVLVNEDLVQDLARKYPVTLPQLNRLVLSARNRQEIRTSVLGNPVDFSNDCFPLVGPETELTDREKLRHTTELVAEFFQIKPEVLNSPSRKQSIVFARCLAIYLAREIFSLSYSNIGEFFDGRDHSTIIHSCKKINKRIALDVDFANNVNLLKSRLVHLASLDSLMVVDSV